ncbi:MAG: S-layer homology domain-containing protein [Eubacteriales bacterium]|nr:S-layer homology domain-containing protein [Eubacteriales bacterium]
MYNFRRTVKAAAALILLLSFVSAPVLAVDVSPALDILAKELNLVKTAATGTDILFSAEDFDRALGVKVDRITIATLPDEASGKLFVGKNEVSNGQSINRSSFGKMKFVPSKNGELETAFTFTGESKYSIRDVECTLYILSDLNFAPTVNLVNDNYFNVSTYEDITYYGIMKAVDPENDTLRYEIISMPKKGLLTVTDRSYGTYKYKPSEGYTGKDDFKFIVYDKYGNISETVNVKIKIQKNKSDVVYSDMTDHWAHNAAIKMADDRIMNVRRAEDGTVNFDPDLKVTRCEFLAMAMTAAGYTVRGNSVNTGFLDNNLIPQTYKGYVAAALELGFIQGVKTGGGYVFNPNDSITRAEAVVFINNIIGLPVPAVRTVFSDNSAIPVWAADAIYALNETGIINGMGQGYLSPYSTLTRAQTAQILYGIINNSK